MQAHSRRTFKVRTVRSTQLAQKLSQLEAAFADYGAPEAGTSISCAAATYQAWRSRAAATLPNDFAIGSSNDRARRWRLRFSTVLISQL